MIERGGHWYITRRDIGLFMSHRTSSMSQGHERSGAANNTTVPGATNINIPKTARNLSRPGLLAPNVFFASSRGKPTHTFFNSHPMLKL
jgi:hypothetical protein